MAALLGAGGRADLVAIAIAVLCSWSRQKTPSPWEPTGIYQSQEWIFVCFHMFFLLDSIRTVPEKLSPSRLFWCRVLFTLARSEPSPSRARLLHSPTTSSEKYFPSGGSSP